jgi:hypothetical protein
LADNKTIDKTGKAIRATEADTMRFVREHTTVSVPEVLQRLQIRRVRRRPHRHGIHLRDEPRRPWETLSEEEKESVVQQLHGYFDELREIKGFFYWCR